MFSRPNPKSTSISAESIQKWKATVSGNVDAVINYNFLQSEENSWFPEIAVKFKAKRFVYKTGYSHHKTTFTSHLTKIDYGV